MEQVLTESLVLHLFVEVVQCGSNDLDPHCANLVFAEARQFLGLQNSKKS